MNTRDKNYSREGQNTGFYQQIQNMNQNQIYSAQPPQQANFFYERPRDTKYEFMESGPNQQNNYNHLARNNRSNPSNSVNTSIPASSVNTSFLSSSGGNQDIYKPYPLEKTLNQTNHFLPNANLNTVMTPQNLSQLQQNKDNRGMDYEGNMIDKQIYSAPPRSYDQTFNRPMNTRFQEGQHINNQFDERPSNSRFAGRQVNVDASNRIMEQSALLRGELQQPKNHFLDFMPTTTRTFRADQQRQEHYR